ncbi:MAG: hypothetical protein HQL41_12745 [Alphaproteobacteria bacterium]|nr:hypothetical protein [Alphaproteobacteria bacterium]
MTIRVEREVMEHCPCCDKVTLHEIFPLIADTVAVIWCHECSHVRTRGPAGRAMAQTSRVAA